MGEVMNAGPGSIRILTVDDHPVFQSGIAAFLAAQPDMKLVAEASNGREAILQFRQHRLEIILMDLQMPEMSGLDAMIAILAKFPEAKIIILTTFVNDVQVAIEQGARLWIQDYAPTGSWPGSGQVDETTYQRISGHE